MGIIWIIMEPIQFRSQTFYQKNWGWLLARVLGSAFCQRRQQLDPNIFKDEDEELSEWYKQLKHLNKYKVKFFVADTSISNII